MLFLCVRKQKYLYQKHILKLFLFCPYLLAVSIASLFGGGTVKHTDGTMASLPLGLMTFHLARWELFAKTHSSSL